MKRVIVVGISGILLVALIMLVLSCASQTTLEISVTELDKEIMIENMGATDCVVSSIRLKLSNSLS